MKNWLYENRFLLIFGLIIIGVGYKSWNFFSKKEVNIGFYHWKKEFDLTENEKSAISKKSKSPLFLHYFDVDWDTEREFIVPRASLNIKSELPFNTSVTPVIFITNKVFEEMPDSLMSDVVSTIWDRINEQNSGVENAGGVIENIQFDCDWTLTTKKKYFDFLEMMNNYANVDLSATIRLHQVKYFEKTGVPPVKKGMLMFYNMGDLENPNTQNSILDLETAKSYVASCKNYPLHLDVALPLFQWAVVYRDGRVVQLLNAANNEDFKDEELFEKTEDQKYKVKESTYVHGFYCYENDVIRLENVTQEQLEAAAKMLSEYLPNTKRTLCFYHLDNTLLQAFPMENLEKIRSKIE
jgi:hypothetical protein